MPRIEKLIIQVLCHATEDREKVLRAVGNVLSGAADKISVSSETLKGYYGDPVTIMRIYLLDENACEEVFLRILSSLSRLEREELWSERAKKGKHGGKLYIRLDKQEAFLGRIRQSDKDPIRIVVEVRGSMDALRKRLEERLREIEARSSQ
ncbi:MAG: RNA-binding domain-containing protein [Nitrososphaerota archaeon]